MEKIAYTVPEALAAIGIGRTNFCKLAAEGKVDLRKVGGRTLVTASSLLKLVENAPKAEGPELRQYVDKRLPPRSR